MSASSSSILVASRTVWPNSIFWITTSLRASSAETSSPIERSAIATSSAQRGSMDGLALEDLGQRVAELVRQEVGQVTEAAEVDAEHGHVRCRRQAHHAQERAVATHADGHRRAGEVDGVEVDLDAGLASPGRAR